MRSAQADVAHLKEAQTHLDDLRALHGDAIAMDDHEAHAEYATWMKRFHAARASLGSTLADFDELGVDVKDVELGLVDFRGDIGGREVFLCWIQGEESITHWHTLDGGFAGRRPIPDLQGPAS